MSSFISDIASSFKPGTLKPIERNIHGIVGLVGLVCSVALAILGAPALVWALMGAVFSSLVVSAIIESKGLAITSYIALFGMSFAAAALTPMPPAVWVVY